MKAWQIILIVCGGLLLLFILFIIGIRRANKKRYYRLRDNLKKVQQENPAKLLPLGLIKLVRLIR